MATPSRLSPGRLLAAEAVIVALAVPALGYLWGVLHELLALRPSPSHWLAIPAAGFLIALLALLARLAGRVEGAASPSPGEDR